MRRTLKISLLLSCAALYPGCPSDIEGFSCESDSDCKAGACVEGLCVTCTEACVEGSECARGECAPTFASLAISSPADGATVGLEYTISAQLTRHLGRKGAFPEALSAHLSCSIGGEKTLSLSLDLQGGESDGLYTGSASSASPESCTLTVEAPFGELSARAGFATAELRKCEPACPAHQSCVAGSCRDTFSALEFFSPANDSSFGKLKGVTVRARLVRKHEGAPPQQLKLIMREEYDNEASEVQMERSGELDYVATVTPPREGDFVLEAIYLGEDGLSALLSAEPLVIHADWTPPVFQLTWDEPVRAPRAIDPEPGYENAYKRNESVTVRVASASDDVEGAVPPKLTVTSVTGGEKIELTSAWSSEHGCFQVEVPLFDTRLPMAAFRGEVALEARGTDRCGNPAEASATLRVTRFGWKVKATEAPINTALAVGATGTIYFTTWAVHSQLHAYSAAGEKLSNSPWELGAEVSPSPAVGTVEGSERVFASGSRVNSGNTEGVLYMVNPEGSATALCMAGEAPATSVGIMVSEGETIPVASFASGADQTLVAARPTKSGAERCVATMLVGAKPAPGPSLVTAITNDTVLIPSVTARLFIARFTPTGSWTLETNSPVIVPDSIDAGPILGDWQTAITAGSYSSHSISVINIQETSTSNTSLSASPISIAMSEQTLLLGTSDGSLLSQAPALPPTTAPISSYPLAATPIIGASHNRYLLAKNGTLFALSPSNETLWSTSLGADSISSPSLDCARSEAGAALSRPGYLFAGDKQGHLHAIITDDHGLDAASPWPKFHRDARNSANIGSTIEACP